MPEFLVAFSYHDTQSYSLWKRGITEDFESHTCVWVAAGTPAEAMAWGTEIAIAFHRYTLEDQQADWRGAQHECWIEGSPDTCSWSHCLEFFQRVTIGQMPQFDQMGTEAFSRWYATHTR